MKLVIERGELMRALGHVTSVVERRTTIPILSNVLLKASSNALQFKATDLEREVQEQAPADVSQPGAPPSAIGPPASGGRECALQRRAGHSDQAVRIGHDAAHAQKAMDLAGEALKLDLHLSGLQRLGVGFAFIAQRIEGGRDDQGGGQFREIVRP